MTDWSTTSDDEFVASCSPEISIASPKVNLCQRYNSVMTRSGQIPIYESDRLRVVFNQPHLKGNVFVHKVAVT